MSRTVQQNANKPGHPRPRPIAAVWAGGAATLALALTGCASADPQPAATVAPVGFASAVSEAIKTATAVQVKETVTTDGKTTFTIDAQVTGIPGGKPQVSEHVKSSSSTVDAIYTDGMFYANTGASSFNHYLEVTPGPKAKDPLAATIGPYLTSMTTAHSPGSLAPAGQGIVFAQPAGPDAVVNGTRTTPYLVAIDTQKAESALALLLHLDPQLAAAIPAEVNADYWLAGDNLPLRVSVITGTTDIEASYQWNASAPISAPAVTQQLTATQFEKLAKAHAAHPATGRPTSTTADHT